MRPAYLLLLTLMACESLDARTAYLTGPEVFEWDNERFHIAGNDAMWGQVLLVDDELSVFVKGFPPGTELALGDARATVDPDGDAMLETSARAQFGTIAIDKLVNAQLDGLTLGLTLPDGSADLTIPLPAQRAYGVDQVLLTAADAPVLFAGETADDTSMDSIIWFTGAFDHSLIGKRADTLADIDGVAIVRRSTLGERVCTGYTGEDGAPAPDVVLELQDATVTVYGRRTGEPVATRTFPPVDECPSWLTGEANRKLRRETSIPRDAVRGWLETVIAG